MVPSRTQTSKFCTYGITEGQHHCSERECWASTASNAASLMSQGCNVTPGPPLPWHNMCQCSVVASPAPECLGHCAAFPPPGHPATDCSFLNFSFRPLAGARRRWCLRQAGAPPGHADLCTKTIQHLPIVLVVKALAGAEPWVHSARFLLLPRSEGDLNGSVQ